MSLEPHSAVIWIALLSYVLGSIPFGFLLVKLFKHQDVRTTGSGNIGATNVGRTAPALGVLTLILDAGKGYGAIWLGQGHAGTPGAGLPPGLQSLSPFIALFFVVLGHIFPVWLKFRGGKGVATAAGAYLALSPLGLGLALVAFFLVVAATRYVSLASIVAASAFPFLTYFIGGKVPASGFAVMIAVSILVIFKHGANIRRLVKGTENRLGQKKNAASQAAAED